MKFSKHLFLATIIVCLGFGSLIGYDLYLKPYVLSDTVVVVRVGTGNELLPRNQILTADDVVLKRFDRDLIPAGALRVVSEVVDRKLTVDATHGQVLTHRMVDMNDLDPGEGEGIFPIPRESIYAVNGSLRVGDKVNIMLIQDSSRKAITEMLSTVPLDENEETFASSMPAPPAADIFIEAVTIVHVRSDDNNEVRDSDQGNVNRRLTSTARISMPELKLPVETGVALAQKIEEGYKLWIIRVN